MSGPAPSVFVYGAGAVGSFLGGVLSAGGWRVTLIGRQHILAPVAADGLSVSAPAGPMHTRPDVAFSLEEAATRGRPDLLLLAMKSHGTRDAAAKIVACWEAAPGGPPPVLTVQNGVDNEEILLAALGRERVLSGALTAAVSAPRPGEVAAEGNRGGLAVTSVAWPGGPGPDLSIVWDRMCEAFLRAGLPLRAAPDYRSLKWSKQLLNLLGNATCAILDQSPAEALADRRVFLVERAAFREACRVMTAGGVRCIDLPGYPVRLLRRVILSLPVALSHRILYGRIATGRGGKLPSFLLDLRSGRTRTEVEFLNGAVAAWGERWGVPAPANAALTACLTGIATGTVSWDEFRGRPDSLYRLMAQRSTRVL